MNSPVEHWQLQLIYDYIDHMPLADVEWLLGKYNVMDQVEFWTHNYSRANELIQRLDENIKSNR